MIASSYQLALASAFAAFLLHTAPTAFAAPAAQQAVMGGDYPSWKGDTKPTAPITNYNEITFFAALSKEGVGFDTADGKPTGAFVEWVSGKKDVTKLLSLGGWSGSTFFSSLVKDDGARKKTAENIAAQMKGADGKLLFTGVSLDWIFPNSKPENANDVRFDRGNVCNQYDANDTENYYEFIKVLRKTLKAALGNVEPTITANVPMNGFFDKTGQKAKDGSMKKWVANDALNYITVMTYDVASNYRELTGINAPLHTCAPEGSGQRFSIEDAIKYWTVTAGVPANKIQLGLPADAKIFQGTEDMQAGNPYFKKTMPLTAPANDKKGSVRAGFWDTQKKDECDAFRDYASTYQYGDLFIDEPAQKATEADPATGAVAMPAYAGTKAFLSNPEKGANGWEYSFDDCTQSPMLYNKDTKQFITYDNPRSIKAKAAFAKAQGLKGIRMFNTHGDYKGELSGAARDGWAA